MYVTCVTKLGTTAIWPALSCLDDARRNDLYYYHDLIPYNPPQFSTTEVIMALHTSWRRLLQKKTYGMKFETLFQVIAGLAITAGFVVIPASLNRQFELRQEALLGGIGDRRSNVLNEQIYNLRMQQRAELLGNHENAEKK